MQIKGTAPNSGSGGPNKYWNCVTISKWSLKLNFDLIFVNAY